MDNQDDALLENIVAVPDLAPIEMTPKELLVQILCHFSNLQLMNIRLAGYSLQASVHSIIGWERILTLSTIRVSQSSEGLQVDVGVPRSECALFNMKIVCSGLIEQTTKSTDSSWGERTYSFKIEAGDDSALHKLGSFMPKSVSFVELREVDPVDTPHLFRKINKVSKLSVHCEELLYKPDTGNGAHIVNFCDLLKVDHLHLVANRCTTAEGDEMFIRLSQVVETLTLAQGSSRREGGKARSTWAKTLITMFSNKLTTLNVTGWPGNFYVSPADAKIIRKIIPITKGGIYLNLPCRAKVAQDVHYHGDGKTPVVETKFANDEQLLFTPRNYIIWHSSRGFDGLPNSLFSQW